MDIKIDIVDSYKPLLTATTRYILCISGRSSAKSTNIARVLLIKGLQKPLRILCAREIQQSIRDSVHRLLSDQIRLLNLEQYYIITDNEIRGVNGTLFIFRGLYNNLTSIKSLEGVDICWIEEAESVSAEALDVLLPTIRKQYSQIIFSMNPRYIDDAVYSMFYANDRGELFRPDTTVIKATFADNPFNSDEILAEIAYMKHHDYERYLHIYEGFLKSNSDASVFKDKFKVEMFDKSIIRSKFKRHFGADFGYSNDPSTLVECAVDTKDRIIYILDAIGAVKVEINALPDMYRKIKDSDKFKIVGDSSRPETIAYLRNHGFPLVVSSKKGKGSIKDGIEFMRSYTTIISPELTDVINEYRHYSYKINAASGQVTDIIDGKDDHFLDSIKYSVEEYIQEKKAIIKNASGW